MYYLYYRDYDITYIIETKKYSEEIVELINFFLGSYLTFRFAIKGEIVASGEYNFIRSFDDWIEEEIGWRVNDGHLYYDEEEKADEKYARLLELIN